MRFALLVLVVLAVPSAALSGAPNYLPLTMGNEWSYVHPTDGPELKVVDRVDTFQGNTVYVLRWESADNDGLENYWTTGPDGDLILWGFYRFVEDFGFAYDPPITYLDAPLSLGRSWSTTTHITYLPDMSDGGTHEITLHVSDEGLLTVPAGTFYSFGIASGPPPTLTHSAARYALTGERIDESLGGAFTWYSDGVGEIEYDGYQLTSYTLPTLLRAATWGGLKAAYR
jgi:hypothetical protein